ncbi:MAG: hypothetical protein AAF547_19080, partial [Actinomycetota bacterium]
MIAVLVAPTLDLGVLGAPADDDERTGDELSGRRLPSPIGDQPLTALAVTVPPETTAQEPVLVVALPAESANTGTPAAGSPGSAETSIPAR